MWNEDDYVHCLGDGRVCVQDENGCLDLVSDADTDLLIYLLNSGESENGSHACKRTVFS